jgi:DNA ligase-associated metallophosphoesterase
MEIQLGNETYILLNEKALFRPKDATLIIADLHLGKAQHFRKHGLYFPQKSSEKDYERLRFLIESLKPGRILLLGDLFHSSFNHEWNIFCEFVDSFKTVDFVLILGNHDILEEKHYKGICSEIIENTLEEGDVIFSHHPLKKIPSGKYSIAGHIHPGVVLYGKGKQHVKLPCFYLFENQLILPAFGSLTGLQLIVPEKKSKVFVVTTNIVMEV